jgi:4-amino-4-deoxy-L-arabinose transferase-like glycosyltransferase
MPVAASKTSLRSDAALLGLCASLLLVIHFAIGNGYGFHRDELQFLSDARHLAWGFVAYPPLTSFGCRIAIALFGISPQVLRLSVTLIDAVSLVLAGLIARELGATRAAQIITVCAIFPVTLVFSTLMQYTTYDLFSWILLAFFTARLLRTNDERNWIGIGTAIGIGVLSKYSIAFPLVSLLAALILLPSQRHHLRSRWFWYGALTAALIAVPNLLWLARHHFITLRMESFIHARDVRHGRAQGFYSDQVKFTLSAFPLAIAGLISLLHSPRFRLLSAFYIGTFLLFAIAKGRGYYMLPAYPVLYAAGAVALERALAQQAKWFRITARSMVIVALLLVSAAFSWAYLPIWRVGSRAWNWQMANISDMRDEIGWPDLVAQVAAVRDSLSPDDRASFAIFANNYGEAGALELYGPQYNLPTAISSTNSFHARGYGPFAPETVLVLGSHLEDELPNFADCKVAAYVHMPYGVRNEEASDQIILCHHLRWPWPDFWLTSQKFG